MNKATTKVGIGGGILLLLAAFSCGEKQPSYQELAVNSTSTSRGQLQTIPGKLQCEYYDRGGEGRAYHDMDSVNNGSGRLNKGPDALSTFRKDEGVDISFTKFHDSIDNSVFNLVGQEEGQLYVGWTEPGEWINYTVDVQLSGTYRIGLMYTANQQGRISLTTEEGSGSGILLIRSTYDAADPVAWRQWHHWNFEGDLGTIELKEGVQVLTLNTVAAGQMNYDYIEFTLKD